MANTVIRPLAVWYSADGAGHVVYRGTIVDGLLPASEITRLTNVGSVADMPNVVAAAPSSPYVASSGTTTSTSTTPTDAGYILVPALGQSNMSGRGTPFDTLLDPPSSTVYQFPSQGPYAGQIVAAAEPLYMHDTASGIGPAFGFARWLAASPYAQGRRVLIVGCAHGGTALHTSATPLGWRSDVAGNLYAQAVTQINAALTAAGTNSVIGAVLWHQGEGDGGGNVTQANYATDLDALVAKLRTDLGVTDLPFLVGGIVPDVLDAGTKAQIHAAHVDTPNRTTRTRFAPGPAGYTLPGSNEHYNAAGQRVLARSYWQAFCRLMAGTADSALPAVPGTPAAPTMSSRTQTQIVIAMPATARATAFRVEYKLTSGSTWTTFDGGAFAGATATITGLSANTSYDFRVWGVNSNGIGVAGAVATISTTASSSGPVVSDSFTRADNTTSMGTADTGQVWSSLGTGAWGIISNTAACYSHTTGQELAVVESGLSDCTVQVTFNKITTNTSAFNRMSFRVIDISNFWIVQYRAGTGKYQVYKYVSGTGTQVGADSAVNGADGDVVKVVCAGSTITVYVNGVQQIQVTDTANQAGTKHGLAAAAASSASRYDDFTVAA